MNKFWKWMGEKDYGFFDDTDGKYCFLFNGNVCECTQHKIDDLPQDFISPQMLIGHKIEYLIEEGVTFNITNYYHRNGIDKVDKFLNKKIEAIK